MAVRKTAATEIEKRTSLAKENSQIMKLFDHESKYRNGRGSSLSSIKTVFWPSRYMTALPAALADLF